MPPKRIAKHQQNSRSKQNPNGISKEAIAQYLTADLDSLTQRAIQHENALSNKINFYLVIVPATIGGLILAGSNPSVQGFVLPLASVILLVLFFLGWVTFIQGLDLSTSATIIYRRMGRIRQWFLDQEPDLYPYLPFTAGDDRPLFYADYARLQTTESVLLVINAVLAAAFGALTWLFIGLQLLNIPFIVSSTPYLIALGISTVLFIGTWNVEVSYIKKFLLRRQEVEGHSNRVHFPSDEITERFASKVIKKQVSHNQTHLESQVR